MLCTAVILTKLNGEREKHDYIIRIKKKENPRVSKKVPPDKE